MLTKLIVVIILEFTHIPNLCVVQLNCKILCQIFLKKLKKKEMQYDAIIFKYYVAIKIISMKVF